MKAQNIGFKKVIKKNKNLLTTHNPCAILIFVDSAKHKKLKTKTENAAVAQSVERRLGKAEVTGPIPVSSLRERSGKSGDYRFFGFSFLLRKGTGGVRSEEIV